MKMFHRLALAAIAVTGMLSTGPVLAASCTLASTNGTTFKTLGLTGRYYTLHVPAGLPAGAKVPVLIHLHGAGEDATFDEYQSGWSPFADQQKFIVAYGQAQAGVTGYWAGTKASSDVTYVKQVADDIAATYCVDPQRIYLDGFSNGALMNQRMACDAADKFAAVSALAGASPVTSPVIGGGTCTPSRPIGVAMWGGDQDPTTTLSYAQDARAMWPALNGCSTTPISTTDTYGTTEQYTGCAGGVQVWWRVLSNTSHQIPSGAAGDDYHSRVWSFLMSHTLP